MESDFESLKVSEQHGWQRTLCFHYNAPGNFARECHNLPVPSRSDKDLNWWHSMKTRNRHDSVNDKQRAGIP